MPHKSYKNHLTGKQECKKAQPRKGAPGQSGKNIPGLAPAFDPELLYVECGRCGAPVIWEPGRIGKLLENGGIDPVELDATCMLVTDGCPACGSAEEYSVRIFRLIDKAGAQGVIHCGHA